MRITINEKKVRRQTLIGRIALYGSLAILLGGVLLSLFGQRIGLLNPDNLGLFYALYIGILVAGFGLSRVGMHYGNRYLTPMRPERVLRDHLKGLDRKYALMLFQLPVDYVLVEPGGVTVLIVKAQGGPVAYKGGRWSRRESIFRQWFGREEPLGNPTGDATESLASINEILVQKLPTLKIPQRAIIIFSDPGAKLDVEPSPIPVLRADGLKDYLRGEGKWKELPASIQRQMREALGAPPVEKLESSQ